MVEKETTCGLFNWRPGFLQPLASKKVYLFLYGVLGIVKSMQYSYLSASLQTIERKFGIKSKETALLMSGNELAQILFLFALPLTVKATRRPLWCGIGLSISALGLYLMALPHFITGYHNLAAVDTTSGKENGTVTDLCGSNIFLNSLEGNCNEDGSRHVDWAGLIFVFIGIGLTGIGNSLFYTFGVVYLDDNSGKGNSPLSLSLTFTFRLVGPTLGYLLGAKCLNTYVYPGLEPGFDEKDPRWIGAWWAGFPIIATLLLVFAAPLCLFPQRLPKTNTDASRQSAETKNLTEEENAKRASFRAAMFRLLKNKLFMWNFFSSIFFVFAFMGFGTFIPKYIESQFRQTGSRSSIYTGTVGTGAKAVGLIVSGYLIGRFKFSARVLSGWNVFLGCTYIGALLFFSAVGCPTHNIYGDMGESGVLDVSTNCNTDCGCPISRPQPICSKDGSVSFYSPCHAGCKTVISNVNRTKVYGDCSCVKEASILQNTSLSKEWVEKDLLKDEKFPTSKLIEQTYRENYGKAPVVEAVSGWCKSDGCDTKFMYFMIAMGILSIIGSTGRVGNLLVALRCVELRDKSLSMAFQVVFMSLLAMLPSPIIYGAIIDKSCILWQTECGETTNCLLYDSQHLRKVMMLTTAAIASLGVLCDVVVCYYAKDVDIFGRDSETNKESDEVTSGLERYGSVASLTKEPCLKQ